MSYTEGFFSIGNKVFFSSRVLAAGGMPSNPNGLPGSRGSYEETALTDDLSIKHYPAIFIDMKVLAIAVVDPQTQRSIYASSNADLQNKLTVCSYNHQKVHCVLP